MQPNTYPDGFPQNPLEAIDFSYFLSDTEKEEWREWLKTATTEQQFELVDTLHAMWAENQKSAVPEPFQQQSNNQGNTQRAPQPAQSSFLDDDDDEEDDFPFADDLYGETGQNAFQTIAEPPQIPQQPPIPPRQSNPSPATEKQNGLAVKNFGNKPYTPSPIIQNDDKNNTDSPFNDSSNSQANQQSSPKNEAPQPATSTQQTKNSKKSDTPEQEQKPFFNVSRLRESATRQQLEELFHLYSKSREDSFQQEKNFRESQGKFMDKIMDVVINFEQVGDFFDSMTQKLLEMNDRLVTQVKEFQEFKSKINTQQNDLSDQIDEIRRDVDRLYREVRDNKGDANRRFNEIDAQLAAFGADAYRQDGILQRLDLILSRLHKAELQIKRLGGDISPSDPSKPIPSQSSQPTTQTNDSLRPTGSRSISVNGNRGN